MSFKINTGLFIQKVHLFLFSVAMTSSGNVEEKKTIIFQEKLHSSNVHLFKRNE